MWRKIQKPYGVFGVGKNLERQEFLLPSDSEVLKRFLGIIITAVALLASAFFIQQAFTVNAAAPIVTTISPDNGPIAGGTKITIEGSGFLGQYEQVEYLYFDGMSYIQTDVTQLNNGTLKNMNVRVKPDAFDKVRFVAGAANSSGQQIFAVEQYLAGRYRFYAASGAATASPAGGTTALASIPAAGMIDIAFDSVRTYHINGSMGAAVGGAPTADSYYQIGGTEGYTNSTNNNYFKGNFYMLRLTDGTTGELLNNLMPAREKSTGNYGVVDLVTGKFYSNAGTGTITGGPVVQGSLAPDRPISVTIDGRACTGVEVISNTELTCHTPSGLSLGQKDVVVSNTLIPSETTTITNGYEYALRLNSVSPKFGDPEETTDIEIEGGVFSTPPDSFVSASVSGIQFDGESWIETGFDQIGSTSYAIDFKLGSSAATLNTGFMGSRSTGSSGSFLVWQLSGTNFRFDYGSSSGATSAYTGILGVRSNILIDDGYAKLNSTRVSDRAKIDFSSLLPAQMLLGSLTTGSGYGTNSFAAYKNYGGVIYSSQICKERSIADSLGVIYQESSLCDSPTDSSYNSSRPERVLVRDLQAAIRTSDGVCGFYDMVTGDFLTNAGYGTFTCTKDTTDNILEVPVELVVNFSYTDINDVEQTGSCSNPVLLSPTKLKCTMPVSPLPNDGQGKVDLTVYANDVEATAGTADADDYYYGSPMVVETISPNRGSIYGGQTVTITGNNFHPSLNSVPTFDPKTDWGGIEITIGGSVCEFELDANDPTKLANASHYTNTSITCMTTANAGGISDIEVTLRYFDEIDQENKTTSYLYGGALDPISGAITSGYLYEDDLFSISPNLGPTTGGTVVTITANNAFLTGANAGVTRVYFGSRLATNIQISPDGKTITATSPANAPGKVDVLVVQSGYAASLRSEALDAFEYELDTETGALTPSRGYISGGDTVRINGTFDTHEDANTTVTFDGVEAVITDLTTDYIEVTTPAHGLGVVNVVITQYNFPLTIANAFTYINPLTITSITPDRGPIDGGTVVTISGSSFVPVGSTAVALYLTGAVSVTIGGQSCAIVRSADYTNTSITCTTSSIPTSGLYDVVISVDTDGDPDTPINPNHTGTLVNGYRYVLSELSLSASNVHIGSLSGTSPYGANSSSVYVQTDNPTGYNVQIKADDSNATTTNDNWMKCSTNPSAQYKSISGPGALTDETWGWNNTSLEPLVWQPINTTNSEFINSGFPSSSGGLGTDTHTVWYGAKTSATQPPCTYSATVMFTAVANPEP